MASRKIALLFSDDRIGCEEFGYITRLWREDADEEDARYERYVSTMFRGKVRCHNGYLTVEST